MNSKTRATFLASAVVIAGLWFGPALAFEDKPLNGLPGWQAVSHAELEATRAKGLDELFDFDATISDSSNGGITINEAGNATITIDGDGGGYGRNVIDDGAFANFSGLSNVILNNGDGAIIQAGIAVTVNVYSGAAP